MGRGGGARVYLGLVPRVLCESPAATRRSQDASDGWMLGVGTDPVPLENSPGRGQILCKMGTL